MNASTVGDSCVPVFACVFVFPGQYTGDSKPLLDYHVKIAGFDEKVCTCVFALFGYVNVGYCTIYSCCLS